jgi:hypothetical protein
VLNLDHSSSLHTLFTWCVVRTDCAYQNVTLPRLESLAALSGASLLRYVCREARLNATRAISSRESTVPLGWILNDLKCWKTFVFYRVPEILTNTTRIQWRHCPYINSLSDHLSRRLCADELCSLDSLWQGTDSLLRTLIAGLKTLHFATRHCLKQRRRLIFYGHYTGTPPTCFTLRFIFETHVAV